MPVCDPFPYFFILFCPFLSFFSTLTNTFSPQAHHESPQGVLASAADGIDLPTTAVVLVLCLSDLIQARPWAVQLLAEMGPSCVAAFVADMAAVAFVKALGRSVEAHAAEWEAAPLGTKIFIFCYKKWFFMLISC